MSFKLYPMKKNILFFVLAGALMPWAQAQNSPKPGLLKTCPVAHAMKASQLYGVWQVTFTRPPAGMPVKAVMRLERHEEFSESLSGTVSRDLGAVAGTPKTTGHAATAALAGDLEDGLLLLDESSDNLSISGTWNGQVTEGSCGRQITGVWKDTSATAPPDAPDVPFTLTKRPGW